MKSALLTSEENTSKATYNNNLQNSQQEASVSQREVMG